MNKKIFGMIFLFGVSVALVPLFLVKQPEGQSGKTAIGEKLPYVSQSGVLNLARTEKAKQIVAISGEKQFRLSPKEGFSISTTLPEETIDRTSTLLDKVILEQKNKTYHYDSAEEYMLLARL